MLSEVFYWVLNMSIIASVFGIFIYFLRFIKGFPKYVSYLLWAIVQIRLLCPFGMNSRYSLLNLLNTVLQKVIVKTIPIKIGLQQQVSLSNAIQAVDSYEPFTVKTKLLEKFFEVGSVIWLVTSLVAILAVLIMYFLSKNELKKATHLRDNIYESPLIKVPTVLGIINPKIVLPIGLGDKQLTLILVHEKIHIRRYDNVWRMLAILTACIHWFNPLIWWFLKVFLADMEIACDALAVKKMEDEDRRDYARLLLEYAGYENTMITSTFGSSQVSVRIKSILTYKKLTLFSSITFLIMGFAIAYFMLTNAA